MHLVYGAAIGSYIGIEFIATEAVSFLKFVITLMILAGTVYQILRAGALYVQRRYRRAIVLTLVIMGVLLALLKIEYSWFYSFDPKMVATLTAWLTTTVVWSFSESRLILREERESL